MADGRCRHGFSERKYGGVPLQRLSRRCSVSGVDKPFEAVIWGWLLVDDEVPRPTPGEVLSGLQLCIGPLGPRYQDLMDSLSVRATVEWAMFDEWNHRINTVIAVDGNRFVYIAPDR